MPNIQEKFREIEVKIGEPLSLRDKVYIIEKEIGQPLTGEDLRFVVERESPPKFAGASTVKERVPFRGMESQEERLQARVRAGQGNQVWETAKEVPGAAAKSLTRLPFALAAGPVGTFVGEQSMMTLPEDKKSILRVKTRETLEPIRKWTEEPSESFTSGLAKTGGEFLGFGKVAAPVKAGVKGVGKMVPVTEKTAKEFIEWVSKKGGPRVAESVKGALLDSVSFGAISAAEPAESGWQRLKNVGYGVALGAALGGGHPYLVKAWGEFKALMPQSRAKGALGTVASPEPVVEAEPGQRIEMPPMGSEGEQVGKMRSEIEAERTAQARREQTEQRLGAAKSILTGKPSPEQMAALKRLGYSPLEVDRGALSWTDVRRILAEKIPATEWTLRKAREALVPPTEPGVAPKPSPVAPTPEAEPMPRAAKPTAVKQSGLGPPPTPKYQPVEEGGISEAEWSRRSDLKKAHEVLSDPSSTPAWKDWANKIIGNQQKPSLGRKGERGEVNMVILTEGEIAALRGLLEKAKQTGAKTAREAWDAVAKGNPVWSNQNMRREFEREWGGQPQVSTAPSPSTVTQAQVAPLNIDGRAVADMFRSKLKAGSIFEGGDVDPRNALNRAAWRSMGPAELQRLIAGQKIGGQSAAGKRGGYFSWFPAYSEQLRGRPSSPKYLVEFKGVDAFSGEVTARPVGREDISAIWESRGGEWRRMRSDEFASPLPSPAAPAAGGELAGRGQPQVKQVEGQGTGEIPSITAKRKGEAGFVAADILTLPAKFSVSVRDFFQQQKAIPGGSGTAFLKARRLGHGWAHRAERYIEKLTEPMAKWDAPTKTAVFRYLNGDVRLEDVPQFAQVTARNVRRAFDQTGAMLVKRGVMKQEQYEAFKGRYVPYLYLRHLLPESELNAMGGSSGKMDLSYIKSRKNLPRAVQEALGLIEDPEFAVKVGLGRELSDIGKYDYMERLTQDPNIVLPNSIVQVPRPGGGKPMRFTIGALREEIQAYRQILSEHPNNAPIGARLAELEAAYEPAAKALAHPPDGYKPVPMDKRYGLLAGSLVHKVVKSDMEGLFNIHNAPDVLKGLQMVNAIGMSAFKILKTAGNPPSIMRNIVTNHFQLNMSGMPWYQVDAYLLGAVRSMQRGDPSYVRGVRNGLFKSNFSAVELKDIEGLLRVISYGRWTSSGIRAMRKLVSYYGKIDDVSKLAKFKHELDRGASEDVAAEQAMKWGMDYSFVPKTIKGLRQSIVPFATFPYKAAALVAEALVKRPHTVILPSLIPYALAQVTMKVHNMTKDEWRRLRSQLPMFIRKSKSFAILPIKDKNGNWQWVDLQYFLPWGQFIEIGRSVNQRDVKGMTSAAGIGTPWLSAFMVAKTASPDTPPSDPYTGIPLYNALDAPKDKALKTLEWLSGQWLGSAWQRYGALGRTKRWLSDDTPDRYGRVPTAPQALGRWVGVNIVAPSPQQVARERAHLILEAQKNLSSILKDPQIAPEKRADAIARFRKRIAEIKGESGIGTVPQSQLQAGMMPPLIETERPALPPGH